MKVQYAIDNFLFETDSRKIYVTSSKGMLDNPEPKEPFKVDYPFRHGEEVFWSPNEVMYKARNITIECFIVASSNSDLITQFNALCAVFRGQMGKKLRRLYVQVDTLAPLFYDVYLSGKIELEKKWSQGQIVGKFTLNLVEPYPTKTSYHLSGLNYLAGGRNLLRKPAVSNGWIFENWNTDGDVVARYQVQPYQAVRSPICTIGELNQFVISLNLLLDGASSGLVIQVSYYNDALEGISDVFYQLQIGKNVFLQTMPLGASKCKIIVFSPVFLNNWASFNQIKLELGNKPTDWTPAPEDVNTIGFTLTNTSEKKKKFNVLFDGILSTSAQSFVLNAGASTAVSQNVSGEFLACVRNPVFSIDDPDHTVTGSSLTITKPYLL